MSRGTGSASTGDPRPDLRIRNATYSWPRAFSRSNLWAVFRERRKGALVSLNNVTLDGSTLERACMVTSHALLVQSRIGRYTIVGPYSGIFYAVIGAFSGLARSTTVGALPHSPDHPTLHLFPLNPAWGLCDRPTANTPWTTVGSDTWIGTGATVMSGLRIGHGAVVGAGAVVTRNVADYEIVAGAPARHLRMRFSQEKIDRLLRLRWWDWPPEVLAAHISLFKVPLSSAVLEQMELVHESEVLPGW